VSEGRGIVDEALHSKLVANDALKLKDGGVVDNAINSKSTTLPSHNSSSSLSLTNKCLINKNLHPLPLPRCGGS